MKEFTLLKSKTDKNIFYFATIDFELEKFTIENNDSLFPEKLELIEKIRYESCDDIPEDFTRDLVTCSNRFTHKDIINYFMAFYNSDFRNKIIVVYKVKK
jgi:hypothetical protein